MFKKIFGNGSASASSTGMVDAVSSPTEALGTEPRSFDLNIEKILEGWENCHAIRELIANALDEQVLTGTKDVEILRSNDGVWHIRDFGRGLRYEHLTQNENTEKLNNTEKVIGKFGVGLKDALATLNRHGVNVVLKSKYGIITLDQRSKSGFSDVITLHAIIRTSDAHDFVGTEITLHGITDNEMAQAKGFFLRFSGEATLDTTRVGHILQRAQDRPARIYVTGILVAEEEHFAFSYNIVSLTKKMRNALNRERTNVGRSAYTDRVKDMLLESRSADVAQILADELTRMEKGTNCDEVKWNDVAVHACKILNANQKVLFVSPSQIMNNPDAIDHAKLDGITIVNVPDNVVDNVRDVEDIGGNVVRDISVYQSEWNQSFKFDFVTYRDLTEVEREIFEKQKAIVALAGGQPGCVKDIKISTTMRADFAGGDHTQGLWEPATGTIIIRRDQLQSLEMFAGTLLHEIIHARSGFGDVTRNFECELTGLIGKIATAHLR